MRRSLARRLTGRQYSIGPAFPLLTAGFRRVLYQRWIYRNQMHRAATYRGVTWDGTDGTPRACCR